MIRRDLAGRMIGITSKPSIRLPPVGYAVGMLRRIGYILVLFALGAAWAFARGHAIGVEHPRGSVAIGADRGRLWVGSLWGPARLDGGWKWARGVSVQTDGPLGIRTGVYGEERGIALILPIWPILLAVATMLAWRWRASRHRRDLRGFPMEGLPADGGPR
jgi:hypothetical protein